MFFCYLCDKKTSSLTGLSMHFKVIHKLTTESTYRCRQGNCNRTFSQYNSFRKHIVAKHTTGNHSSFSNHNVISSRTDISVECNDSNDHAEYCSRKADQVTDKTNDDGSFYLDLHTFKSLIKMQARILAAKLYSMESLPRSMVQVVIDEFLSFLGAGFVDVLQQRINGKLRHLNVDANFINTIDVMFDVLKNPFDFISSEYLRFKDLQECDSFVKPVSSTVTYRMDTRVDNERTIIRQVPVTVQVIPLQQVLKRLFELPHFYERVSEYTDELKRCHNFTNFMQGDLWKEKTKKYHATDIVLPLFIYFDDYESCNPLGSHAGVHKIGAVYASFPFLPPHFRSKLDNIVLVSLFYSEDRRSFGNEKILGPVIKQLISLESFGVDLKICNKSQRIYFVLGLILGDNLGLNSLLGYVESFSSNYCCRFCLTHKSEMEKMCHFEESRLRIKSEYNNHVLLNEPSQTGIKETCVFNTVPSFHVYDNFSVDLMHDILEGVSHYDLINILNYCINVKQYFSLVTLNYRISTFQYGLDIKNKPPQICALNLDKKKLCMSSSEMSCFLKFFGLMVGDLVPEHDPVWEIYLSLREILDIVMANTITSELTNSLDVLVSEHNSLFIDLFKEKLKPKFHFLLHYASVMRKVGPVRHIWSMRYESKHRQSKMTANATLSRRNILYTLALKQQLILSSRLLTNRVLERNYILGPPYESPENDFSGVCAGPIALYKWISINGITYKKGVSVITDFNDLLPTFGIVQYVAIKNDTPGILCCTSDVVCYNSHFHAFEIVVNSDCIKYYNIHELFDPFPCHVYYGRKKFVTLNYSV